MSGVIRFGYCGHFGKGEVGRDVGQQRADFPVKTCNRPTRFRCGCQDRRAIFSGALQRALLTVAEHVRL